jgi:NTP pyrophosphatase (non-canonical NTP hydrolase)
MDTCHSEIVSDLDDLTQRMREFTKARDWEQFHDPKSLILAMVGEVGELSELFQWLPADAASSLALDEPLRTRVSEELSDVLLYLIRLADVLDVNLGEAAAAKLSSSEERFRPEDFSGTAPVKQ